MIPIKLFFLFFLVSFSYQKVCTAQGKIGICKSKKENIGIEVDNQCNSGYVCSVPSDNNKKKRLNRKDHLDLAIKETVKAFAAVSKNMMNEAANVAKNYVEEIKHSIEIAVKDVTDQAKIVLSAMKGEEIPPLPLNPRKTQHKEEEPKKETKIIPKLIHKPSKNENLRLESLLFIESEEMFTVENNNS